MKIIKKNNKKININDVIALCHMLDNFKEFNEKLMPIICSKNNRNFEYKLLEISKGKFINGSRNVKKFYNENKRVIDTINNYSDIKCFIRNNYIWPRWYGIQYEEMGINFFYEYLLSHKEDLSKILKVLGKLKELGFTEFEFNEELDFTKETYSVYPTVCDNYHLTYVANPQVIPNYASHINFTTADSNYKMELDVSNYSYSKPYISECCREIVLNSLLFNPSTLPEKIDIEHTHGQLVRLKNEQKENEDTIRNSVNLDMNISVLESALWYMDGMIKKFDDVENKQQLLEVLSSIKDGVEQLRNLSNEYNNSISEKNELLTPEYLQNEKKLLLERREWSRIQF